MINYALLPHIPTDIGGGDVDHWKLLDDVAESHVKILLEAGTPFTRVGKTAML
jgi:hypothetical protein